MADLRDYRFDISTLTIPPGLVEADLAKVAELKAILGWFFTRAVVVNEGLANEERGSIAIQRCGHRLGIGCDVTDKWIVGQGKVI